MPEQFLKGGMKMISADIPYSPAAIRRLLLKLGATPRYIGFEYVLHAIVLSLETSQYLLSVTKELYPDVAKKYHTTIYSVERDIRTVITIIWKRNPVLLNQIAGYPLDKKPAVGEFIAIMREYLLYHMEAIHPPYPEESSLYSRNSI